MRQLLATFTVALAIIVAIMTGCASVGQATPPLVNTAVVDSTQVKATADSIKAVAVADSIKADKAMADSVKVVSIKVGVDNTKAATDSVLVVAMTTLTQVDNIRVKAEKAKDVNAHVRADSALARNTNVMADSSLSLANKVKVLTDSVKNKVDKMAAVVAEVVADSSIADSTEALTDSVLADSVSVLANDTKALTDSIKVLAQNAMALADSAYILAGKAKTMSIRTKLSILTEVVKWPQPYGQVDYDQERGAILYGKLDETTGMKPSIVFSQLDTLQHPDGLPDFIKDPDGNIQITAEGRRDENGGYVSSSFFCYHPEVEAIWDAFGKIRNLRREGGNYKGKFTFANRQGERVEVILNDLDPKQHPFGFPSFKRAKNGDLLLVANYKDGNQAVFAITMEEMERDVKSLQKLFSK